MTETVSIPGEDGTFHSIHSVTASCHVPASTVSQDVVFTVVHDERVEAEVTARAPLTRTRTETLALASSVRGDDPYRSLAAPEPEPEPDPLHADARHGRRPARVVRRPRMGVGLVRRA